MGREIHVKKTEEGYQVWQTEAVAKGKQVRVKDSQVLIQDFVELDKGATVFANIPTRLAEQGASSDHSIQ